MSGGDAYCQCDGDLWGVDADVQIVLVSVLMVFMVLMVLMLLMVVFRYKFALRPEEKPGLEGFLTFLWNKETGEVSVSLNIQAVMSCGLVSRGKISSDSGGLYN